MLPGHAECSSPPPQRRLTTASGDAPGKEPHTLQENLLQTRETMLLPQMQWVLSKACRRWAPSPVAHPTLSTAHRAALSTKALDTVEEEASCATKPQPQHQTPALI